MAHIKKLNSIIPHYILKKKTIRERILKGSLFNLSRTFKRHSSTALADQSVEDSFNTNQTKFNLFKPRIKTVSIVFSSR